MRATSGNVGATARELAVPALAARQHGVVSRGQLLGLGLTSSSIDRRMQAGRLHPIHRGVYLVGHALPPPLAVEMAAVLACGKEATCVSHASAASLWKLLPSPSPSAAVAVISTGFAASKPGIRVHRVKAIHPRERRSLKGIPLTSPARTLLDCAASVPTMELERMVAEAWRRNIVTHAQLADVLERHPRRRGATALRRLLAAGKPRFTRSEAERRMLALVRAAGLPEPETNVRLGPYELDFLWRKQRFVVEVDGYAFHSDRASFERDRRRDAALLAEGIRTARVTWEQLCEEADGVAGRLRRSLSAPF